MSAIRVPVPSTDMLGWRFADGVTQKVWLQMNMPPDSAELPSLLRLHVVTSVTTGNIYLEAAAHITSYDAAVTTPSQSALSTATVAARPVAWAKGQIDMSLALYPLRGTLWTAELRRVGAHANDTLAGDLYVLSASLVYPRIP